MRLMMSIASMLLVGVVAGCSDPVGPESIVGLWDLTETIPGNYQEMLLALDGSIVTGNGSACGEAARCGTSTVTGTAMGSRIHLVTTFDSGLIETFDGRLISANILEGTVVTSTTPGMLFSQSFRRVIGDPPTIQ
jgi:hypothetical protein